jgi:uncharacterized membrane protein
MALRNKPIAWVLCSTTVGLLGTWTAFILAKVFHNRRYIDLALVCFGVTTVIAAAPIVGVAVLRVVQRLRDRA